MTTEVPTTDSVPNAPAGAAQDLTLDRELAQVRQILDLLVAALADPELPPREVAAVARLVFAGARTVAALLKQMAVAEGGGAWEEVLDELARDLDVEL